MESLCRYSLTRPFITCAAIALLTIGLASQLVHMRAETGYRAYLGKDHETIRELEDFIDAFGGGLPMAAVWACDEAAPCDSVFDEIALTMAARVVDQLSGRHDIRRIESPATTPVLIADEDFLDAVTLHDGNIPLPPSRRVEQLRSQAVADPSWRRTLVSPDGKVGAILLELSSSDSDASKATLRALEAALLPFEAQGFRYHIVGQTSQFALTDEALAADSARLTPIMVVLVAVVILVLFRSWQAVLGALATVGLATLWTLSTMAMLRWPQNAITETIAPLILVMALSDAVHLLSRYAQARELRGAVSRDDRRAEMLRAAREAGRPCLVTTLTTAAGFASFATSDLESFVRFGIVCSAGILAALLLTFTVLPILMIALPADHIRSSKASAMWDRILTTIVDGTRRNTRFIAWTAALLGVVFAFGASRLSVDIDEYKLYGEDSDVVKGFRFLEANLQKPDTLEIEVTLPANAELFQGDVIDRLSALAGSLAAIDGLGPVHSVLDIMAWTNRLLNANDPAFERLADSGGENAELLTVISMKDPMALDKWLSPNFRRLRFSVEAEKRPQSARGEVLAAVGERLQLHLGDEWDWRLTGSFAVYYDMTRDIQKTQLYSFAVAVVVVFAVLAIFLRTLGGSTRRAIGWAAIGMLPTILPVIVTFGVMGYASVNLDIGTAMVAAILIGIGVDDTIHLLGEFYRRRLAGQAAAPAIQNAVLHVGQAVLTTSAALCLGFLVLTLSSWQSIASFGFLSGVAILGALAADLWILPALILLVSGQHASGLPEEKLGSEQPPDEQKRVALTALVVVGLSGILLVAADGISGSGTTTILSCRTMPNGVVPVIAGTNSKCNLRPLDRVLSVASESGPVLASDRAAFTEAISRSQQPARLTLERGRTETTIHVPVLQESAALRLQQFLGALALTVAAMSLALRIFWHSKAKAAPALLLLFAAMCGELVSIICDSHGSTLQWVSAPIAPLIAASLTHLALTFPRERPLLQIVPSLVFVPYLMAALLAAIELRGLSFDPSFWALSVRLMLVFATCGAALLGVNAIRAVRSSSSPLQQARARILFVSFLGIPMILGSIAFAWGPGVPGGQLTFMFSGIATFVLPLGYSITRYDLFDFPPQARRTIERVLHLVAVGVMTSAIITASEAVIASPGPLVWCIAGGFGYLAASTLRSWLTSIVPNKFVSAARLREGLVASYQHGSSLLITEDASARLIGRTLGGGLDTTGISVFVASGNAWRPAFATREHPALTRSTAASADRALGSRDVLNLSRGDTADTPDAELLRESGVELVVGIDIADQRLGLVLIAAPPSRLAYQAEEIRFARSLSRHAAQSMYSARISTNRLTEERQRALTRHAAELAHELGSPLRVLERRARRIMERSEDPSGVMAEASKIEVIAKHLLGSVYNMAGRSHVSTTAELAGAGQETPLHDAILAAAESLDSPGQAGQVLLFS